MIQEKPKLLRGKKKKKKKTVFLPHGLSADTAGADRHQLFFVNTETLDENVHTAREDCRGFVFVFLALVACFQITHLDCGVLSDATDLPAEMKDLRR